MPQPIEYLTANVDGVKVFYRSSGNTSNPVLLLLHGFPTSSHQFRNLIPLLSDSYRVIAPDLPGFGFTVVPEERKYVYTFDNLANTISSFIDELGLKKYALYVFDYGAPTGYRIAASRPSQITGLIIQNGNAYHEGLGVDFWAPLQKYWKSASSFDPSIKSAEAQALLPTFKISTTEWQYTNGVPDDLVSHIDPAAWHLDSALLQQPGQEVIQLALFFDYQNNVALYPVWQKYFRKEQPKVLILWGENDVVFPKEGAEAFRKDLPNAKIVYFRTGHFPLETHHFEYAENILQFKSEIA